MAASVIAEDVVAAGLPARRRAADPAVAPPLPAGRRPGARRPAPRPARRPRPAARRRAARVLVLGGAVDRMLADAFEARALDTGGPPWPDWLDVLVARDQLAPRIDLAAVARAWARRTPSSG